MNFLCIFTFSFFYYSIPMGKVYFKLARSGEQVLFSVMNKDCSIWARPTVGLRQGMML